MLARNCRIRLRARDQSGSSETPIILNLVTMDGRRDRSRQGSSPSRDSRSLPLSEILHNTNHSFSLHDAE